MKSKVILVRHGNDDDGLTNHIDGLDGIEPRLSATGYEESLSAAKTIVDELALSQYHGRLNIYSSPKIRVAETTEIITKEIEKSGFRYDLFFDDRLANPYYGEIQEPNQLSHDDKVKLFRLAWRAFDESCRLKHDFDYRFGTPYGQYEGLEEFFKAPHGESQNEICARVCGSLSEILKGTSDCNAVPIVVTHKTVARDIHGFLIAQETGDIHRADYQIGSLLRHGEVLNVGLNSPDFCIAAIQANLQRLRTSCRGEKV